MLFGFVAIVLPPAPSWSRRYVPAYTTFLLKKRHPCLYHSSTCATASSACGSTPALSTAAAMSRAMAMTTLIDKLTSRPFVFFGMFHPSPREQAFAEVGGCRRKTWPRPSATTMMQLRVRPLRTEHPFVRKISRDAHA